MLPVDVAGVSLLLRDAQLLGALSDARASQAAEKPPEGARWDRSPQREREIH